MDKQAVRENIPPEDLFDSLAGPGEASAKIKQSKFFALAAAAADWDAASKIIQAREEKLHSASHHCWGWRSLGMGEIQSKSSDAGEPSGTAGGPILDSITGENLLGVVVVVSRFFGGTKLGCGPLSRAYAQCAQTALMNALRAPGIFSRILTIECSYSFHKTLCRIIDRSGALILSRDFAQEVGLKIAVPVQSAKNLIPELKDKSAGKIKIASVADQPIFLDSKGALK